MKDIVVTINAMPNAIRRAFSASQKAWTKYCESEAKFLASIVEGGSMYPTLYSTEKASLVNARSEKLIEWIEREENR